jgi:hypothetical protein
MEEMLVRGPPSAVSRIALEIDAVSPLRNASTILNFFTDCSRVAPFSCTGLVRDGAAEGVLLRLPGDVASLEPDWLRMLGC